MTKDDEKNIEILSDMFQTNFDLEPRSIEFAKNWLRKPNLHPEFAKIVGDDFRARWPIPFSKLGEKDDKSWSLFKSYFRHAVSELNISYENFINNVMKYKGDDMKISKVLNSYYNTGAKLLDDINSDVYNDFGASVSEQKGRLISGDEKIVKESINLYITKANEIIGRYKAPKDKAGLEIVLSFNFADWLLASTGDGFSSCIGLKSSHGFWYGLPFMLDDRNRGFLYITNKNQPKKEFLGLKVDPIRNREWVFLDEEGNLHGYRWYPGTASLGLSNADFKKITGLPLIEGCGFRKSKYPIGENIHIEGGKNAFCTPYLDSVGIIRDQGKYWYSTNGHTGTNVLGEMPSKIRGNSPYNGSMYLEVLRKTKLGVISSRFYQVCACCEKKEEKGASRFHQVINGEEISETVCHECYEKKYVSCQICSNIVSKEIVKKTSKHKEGVCPRCYKEFYKKCECCGEYFHQEDLKDGFCEKCAVNEQKVAKNALTDCLILIKKAIIVFSSISGNLYFSSQEELQTFLEDAEENKFFSKFSKCPDCNNFYENSKLFYSITGDPYCEKCGEKIAMKKQLWFDFGTSSKRKKKKVEARAEG